MTPRVIKTDEDHQAALREIEALAALDPKPGSPEAERLELLAVLVEDYERKRFRVEPPDPVSALRFRMEQQGLSRTDLIPFLGSRARVSEVLSGKRPLSLAMIRALHHGLGIPAEVLIGRQKEAQASDPTLPDWSAFPVRLMARRGWLQATPQELRHAGATLAERYIRSAFDLAAGAIAYRKSFHQRARKCSDPASLLTWTARVLQLADAHRTERFVGGRLDEEFLTRVARLSAVPSGPLVARELLAFNGIALVFEPALPKTFVDGCSLLLKDGRPAIGMSLRYDRLDNFWFTLLHELAHVVCHLTRERPVFVDDLDDEAGGDPLEAEADRVASEALIPQRLWRASKARKQPTAQAVGRLAAQLSIHPAIPAGRLRRELHRYDLLSDLLGQGEVSAMLGQPRRRKGRSEAG